MKIPGPFYIYINNIQQMELDNLDPFIINAYMIKDNETIILYDRFEDKTWAHSYTYDYYRESPLGLTFFDSDSLEYRLEKIDSTFLYTSADIIDNSI